MEIKIINDSLNSELALSEESFTFVLQSVDWGEVEVKHNTASYVDTIGEEVLETFFNPRTIQIIGWILGNNKEQVKARKNVLNRLINPKNNMRLLYKNYVLKVRANRTVKYGVRYQENNEKMCKFTLDLVAHMPLFMLKDETIRTEISIKSAFRFPLVVMPTMPIVFGVYPEDSINNMFNDGDVNAGFIITLYANGNVKNPAILNNDTGQEIRIMFDLVVGDEVKIVTMQGNKYIELSRNGVISDITGSMTRESVLFNLGVGVNRFELVAEENVGSLDIGIEYAPRYLEVQD